MVKYFHELTEDQVEALASTPDYCWAMAAEDYPQPPWCTHARAVNPLGCASLVYLRVTGPSSGPCQICHLNKDRDDG